jgi:SPP1 gp7 family putative phage head morphogenesis protein
MAGLRTDPSRTLDIRRAFLSEMARRFRDLNKEIADYLGTQDAFGLNPAPASPFIRNAFDFRTTSEKLDAFKAWLKDRISSTLLGTDRESKPWTAKFIESAHMRGVTRAYTDTAAARGEDINRPSGLLEGSQAAFLRQTFASPQRASKIELLATRDFSQLKGITDSMDAKMSTIFADGVSNGKGAYAISRELQKQVGIDKVRADRLARTEVIHAHADGQLDGFEELGVEELAIMAEVLTAGDSKVCPLCSGKSGKTYTIAESRNLIPFHPNCRCCWMPSTARNRNKGRKPLKGLKTASGRAKAERAKDEKIQAPAAGLWGLQPTAVVRWMGKEGWSFEDAKKALAASDVSIADATLKIQLRAGKTGERGDPATLTAEQIQQLNTRRGGLTAKPPVVPPPPPITPPVDPRTQAALDKLAAMKGKKYVQIPLAVDTNENAYPNPGQLFEKPENYSIQQVAFQGLKATQEVVDRDRVKWLLEHPDHKPEDGEIRIVKYKGKNYIHDGHHRAIAAYLKGDTTVNARVIEVDQFGNVVKPPVVPPVVVVPPKPPVVPPIAPATGWKPTMSKEEADKWAANSAHKADVFHVTTDQTTANSIMFEGFRSDTIGSGKAYGNGSYFATDAKTAEYYKKLAKEDGNSNPVMLTARVNVKSILEVDTSQWKDTQKDIKTITFSAAKQVGKLDEYLAQKWAIEAENQAIMKRYKPAIDGHMQTYKNKSGWVEMVDAEAFKRTAIASGYDAIRIKDNTVDPALGGNQLLVFDKKSIVVIDPKKSGVLPKPPVIVPPKPPVIPPLPPVVPPKPIVILPPLPPVPPVVEKPTFNQSPTAIVRALGKQGYSFDEAKRALAAAGLDAGDATIRTQLNAGKKGQRGDPAQLTEAQIAFLNHHKNNTTTTTTTTKPKKVESIGIKAKPLPPTVEIKPVAAVDKDKPDWITHTGKADDFTKTVWKAIGNKRSLDPDNYREVGKLVMAEVNKDPGLALMRDALSKMTADSQKAWREYDLVSSASYGITDAKNKNPTPENIAKWKEAIIKVEEAAKRATDSGKDMAELQAKMQVARSESLLTNLKRIRDFGNGPLKYAPGSSKELVKYIDGAADRLPTDWVKGIQKTLLKATKVKRGFFYSGSWRGSDISDLALSGHDEKHLKGVAMHELTHCVESFYRLKNETSGSRDMGYIENKFLISRKKPGEEAVPIAGDPGAKGYKDGFNKHYIGRVYGSLENFEILSMGVEQVLEQRNADFNDEDLVNFTVGMLAGH